jgi:hypothetical protein
MTVYLPCLATITLETASGTLVPAARNVIPITESGIFNVSPEKYQNNQTVLLIKPVILKKANYFIIEYLYLLTKSIAKVIP